VTGPHTPPARAVEDYEPKVVLVPDAGLEVTWRRRPAGQHPGAQTKPYWTSVSSPRRTDPVLHRRPRHRVRVDDL